MKTDNLQEIVCFILLQACLRVSCLASVVPLEDDSDINTNNVFRSDNTNTPESKIEETSNAKLNIISKVLPRGWSSIESSEPGFDLTKEEMTKFKIWPYGVIPYYIDDFSFDSTYSSRLRLLLESINSVTGLHFVELFRPPENESERWVFFINRRGLLSCEDYDTNSFTIKGVQKVVLGYDCVGVGGGALAPVVLALAGVPPQHNAPDRDRHINVQMDNVIPEKKHLFKVLGDKEWLFHHVKYDFLSAGHYDFHKYTVSGSATIVPKQEVQAPVGEGDGISYNDIWKIRMLYNYISRNRPKAKASDCSKLFKPGVKFSQFEPLSDDHITPRKKPNKYLGISDDIDETVTFNSVIRNSDDNKDNEDKNILIGELDKEKLEDEDNDHVKMNKKKYSKKNQLKHLIKEKADWNTSE